MPQVNDAPWSAAFIVWVVNEAAKKTTGLTFPTGPSFVAHTEYANAIRRGGFPWKAFKPTNFGIPIKLQPGDIVVINRANNNLTFDRWDRTTGWGGFSHGDVVIEDEGGPGFTIIGGNLSNRVRSDTKYGLGKAFVVLRPNNIAHGNIIRDVAKAELELWENNKWISENQAGARERVALYWNTCGLPYIPSAAVTGVISRQAPVSPAAISPFIESLESFHPNIQYELTRRRVSAETANVYTPFVKLTSLSEVKPDNLPDGQTSAYCPSLGIHGQDSVSFDDIYLPKDNKSIIGYAIANDGATTVPVVVSNSTRDAANIPIPGITQFTVERSTAGPMGVRGGLVKADLKIVAYSIGQVDTLLTYYLRPATRLVLELGRISANQKEKPIKPFDWKLPKAFISDYFSRLIKSPRLQNAFIKEYIYNNNGNYEAFITYVVKFNLKYNKNNTFEIDLTLHSVQQFEVTTKHTAVQSSCPSPTKACDVMDIQEYFNGAYDWKNNSFSKLMSRYQNDIDWGAQIVPIKNKETNEVGAQSTQAGTRENEYYVSWTFFIEKILNDREYGIAAMLGDSTSVGALSDLALLRPVANPTGSFESGLISNQCGYHPNLRSVSPGVMIIYNPEAQARYENSKDKILFESVKNAAASGSREVSDALKVNTLSQQISGSSVPFTNTLNKVNTVAGASSLTNGVWLNTQAIKQAFTSTDTISSAISSLLSMMNSATEGYWNLQLYSTDVKNPGLHVIDMGLSKEPKLLSKPSFGIDREEAETNNILNSITGITPARYRDANEDEPKYIYMFNRGTKLFDDGELGSELIDLNVEFNLPQVIAVQAIANIGGPAQKPLLSSINVKELQEISLIKGLYASCGDSADDASCESDEIRKLRAQISEAELANQTAQGLRAPLALRADISTQLALAVNRNITATNLKSLQDKLDATKAGQFNPNLVGTIREYASLGTVLELIEINPSRMMKELNIDSVSGTPVPRSTTHAFNSSNLTKTVIDITLPGIGGIGLFQSFLVDRIPSIITRGFYVVTKVTHEFTTQNGWITKIQGRFRFRPDGTSESSGTTGAGTSGTSGTGGSGTARTAGTSTRITSSTGTQIDLTNLTSAERDAYSRGGLARLQELRNRGY